MPTVLVTGGGRGIGRAIALKFAEPGSIVAIASRTRSELEATGAEIEKRGAKAMLLTVDVTDEASVQGAVDQVNNELGPIDILVANAGALWMGTTLDTPLKRWELCLRDSQFCSSCVIGAAL